MPRFTCKKALYKKLPQNGSFVSNKSLMKQLRWPEDKFYRYRNELLEEDLVDTGKGQGGSTARVKKEEKVFQIKGPFEIKAGASVNKGEKGYHFFIERPSKNGDFWKRNDIGDNQNSKGVYVFCFKNGKSFSPIYVGLASGRHGFSQECFTKDKLNKVLRAWSYDKGKPYIFFLCEPKIFSQRGHVKGRKKTLADAETLLIQLGRIKNSNLENDRKTKPSYQAHSLVRLLEKPPKWAIPGIAKRGSGKGSGSVAASKLRKCFGL